MHAVSRLIIVPFAAPSRQRSSWDGASAGQGSLQLRWWHCTHPAMGRSTSSHRATDKHLPHTARNNTYCCVCCSRPGRPKQATPSVIACTESGAVPGHFITSAFERQGSHCPQLAPRCHAVHVLQPTTIKAAVGRTSLARRAAHSAPAASLWAVGAPWLASARCTPCTAHIHVHAAAATVQALGNLACDWRWVATMGSSAGRACWRGHAHFGMRRAWRCCWDLGQLAQHQQLPCQHSVQAT
jgi:hypothetical protein